MFQDRETEKNKQRALKRVQSDDSKKDKKSYLEDQIFSESESIRSAKDEDKNSFQSDQIKVTAQKFKQKMPNFEFKEQIEDLNEQYNKEMLDKKVGFHLRTSRFGKNGRPLNVRSLTSVQFSQNDHLMKMPSP